MTISTAHNWEDGTNDRLPDTFPDTIGEHWLSFTLPASDVAKGYNAWCTRCGDLFRNWQEAETFACIPHEDQEEDESVFIECQQCKEVYAASRSDDCPHHPDDPDEEDFPR